MSRERIHLVAALALIIAAAGTAWIGQPDASRKWTFLEPTLSSRLDSREVYIDAMELIALTHDNFIDLRLIDIRDEQAWNLFHLWGARHLPLAELERDPDRFRELSENAVIVLVGEEESASTDAWKTLMATANRPNAYILSGGINGWLDRFAPDEETGAFQWALGSRHPAARPAVDETALQDIPRKVRLLKKVVKKGGCG